MIALTRLKDGATFALDNGDIYKLVTTKQVWDGQVHRDGAEDFEIKHWSFCQKLGQDNQIRFSPFKKVILLEGETLY